ncbi:MAG: hypothetical protein DMD63_14445 [Gemmatimonadetes bacterium]|nr:MAG: hypothetical protein DMD63_14445 [Gemmatimonadota bacterium]
MRKQILFLSQSLPFPPHSGVTNRTYHILQELQREHDVTLVAFSRRNHQPDAAGREGAAAALRREISNVMHPVPLKSEWSIASKLLNHGLSVLTREPYIFYEYGNQAFGDQLGRAVDQVSPDLVHLDSMDLYRWLDRIPPVPTACTHHNLESELLRLRGEHIPSRLVGAYVEHQAKLVENVERRLTPQFDLNVMTSVRDAERLRALAGEVRTHVTPNGVDVEYFRPTPPAEVVPGRVTFLGPTYMFPNRDATDFFLAEAWPSIRRGCRDSSFHLIGKNSPAEKARFESYPSVACHGYVADIRPYFAETACSVVPLRVGGGTSTSIGCEGLETVDGTNILIRDDPKEFAEAVVDVLRDDKLRYNLGHEARKTAERCYAWPVVGRELNAKYKQLLAGAPAELSHSVPSDNSAISPRESATPYSLPALTPR